ncbi:MAG TPA: hypothetical protein VJO34_16530 [Methylomirabilota bacterium]|nr:hypothetical protein [Methylomirabilota bacterium]
MRRCLFCRGPVKRAFEWTRAGDTLVFCGGRCFSLWDRIGPDFERCKVLRRVHKHRALRLIRHAYEHLGGRRWEVFESILRPFL